MMKGVFLAACLALTAAGCVQPLGDPQEVFQAPELFAEQSLLGLGADPDVSSVVSVGGVSDVSDSSVLVDWTAALDTDSGVLYATLNVAASRNRGWRHDTRVELVSDGSTHWIRGGDPGEVSRDAFLEELPGGWHEVENPQLWVDPADRWTGLGDLSDLYRIVGTYSTSIRSYTTFLGGQERVIYQFDVPASEFPDGLILSYPKVDSEVVVEAILNSDMKIEVLTLRYGTIEITHRFSQHSMAVYPADDLDVPLKS